LRQFSPELLRNLPPLTAVQAEIERRATARAREAQERQAAIESAGEAERTNWSAIGRPGQQLPIGDWLTWLILAGRGWGKSRTGAEAVRALVCGNTPLSVGRYGRVALIAETAADARDVMVEGLSGILSVHPRAFRPLYEPSKRRLTWPNGAVATVFNATEPDQLRGPQYDLAWADELAKWAYVQEAWDQLQFGLRLRGPSGERPRQIVTTTPRPIALVRELVKASDTVVTTGKTIENRANLAPSFITKVVSRYAGTRLGRQELNAEVLDDVPGALWTRETIDRARRIVSLPEMVRIVVAVDPSGARGADDDAADAIGIVVAGKGIDGRGYVLADYTCKLSPSGWARRAVEAYRNFEADCVIAERNYGGAMVESTIRAADANVPYREVTASRGKAVRAEPISLLYEQHRVSHIGDLSDLEDEMCNFSRDGYLGEGSPNRADAVVWALSELMIENDGAGFLEFMRQESEKAEIERRAAELPKGTGQPAPKPAEPTIAVKPAKPPAAPSDRRVALRAVPWQEASGLAGRQYRADPQGVMLVDPEDAPALEAAGFRRVDAAA
jgi:phage terminase large subunit-like protein